MFYGQIEGSGFEIVEPEFASCFVGHARLDRLWTGCRWAEGPAWFAAGRYLIWSDLPNNRQMRYDDTDGSVSVFRQPSGFANGNTVDLQGRLISCEHQNRRVTRTEHNGAITVLASHYQGRRLNSPNDVVVKSDGSIWFTDPPFGIGGHWEGEKAEPELPHAVYRIDPATGELQQVLTELAGPNGLAFSPDERVLYIVESRAQPHRKVWAYDVDGAGQLSGKRLVIDAQGPGALDGIAVDEDGNLWCGWGSNGSPQAQAEGLDGVRVFNPQGLAIGHIHLPERCANLCFGGAGRNRLYMAASHSLYALYVETRGA